MEETRDVGRGVGFLQHGVLCKAVPGVGVLPPEQGKAVWLPAASFKHRPGRCEPWQPGGVLGTCFLRLSARQRVRKSGRLPPKVCPAFGKSLPERYSSVKHFSFDKCVGFFFGWVFFCFFFCFFFLVAFP